MWHAYIIREVGWYMSAYPPHLDIWYHQYFISMYNMWIVGHLLWSFNLLCLILNLFWDHFGTILDIGENSILTRILYGMWRNIKMIINWKLLKNFSVYWLLKWKRIEICKKHEKTLWMALGDNWCILSSCGEKEE